MHKIDIVVFEITFLWNMCQVGMQNSSLGVVLATMHFASPLTAVPAAVSAVLMNIMGSGLAVVWRNINFNDFGGTEQVEVKPDELS